MFPNSNISNLEVIKEFDIIEKEVNGKKCKTLKDYRNAIKKTIKIKNKNYIEIITEVNKEIVLLINDLLDEEILFSKLINIIYQNYINF